MSLGSDALRVNGGVLDFFRNDQRREPKVAERCVCRAKLLGSMLGLPADLSDTRSDGLRLSAVQWEIQLPTATFLGLPDVSSDPNEAAAGWLVDRSQIAGRVLPWSLSSR